MENILQTLLPWSTSIGILIFFIVLRYIYRRFLFNLLHKFALASSFPYDEQILEAFENPINIVLAIGGIYGALIFAPVPFMSSTLFIDRVLRSTIVLAFFWGCYNLSDTTHGMMLDLFTRIGIRTEEAVSNIFSTILRIIIVVLGFVTIAKEWNYDISGFVASLGIGSLAIAFAAKDALANVFGSLIIILDKPFKIGDWITANGIFPQYLRTYFPAGACLHSELSAFQHAYHQLYHAPETPRRFYAGTYLQHYCCSDAERY